MQKPLTYLSIILLCTCPLLGKPTPASPRADGGPQHETRMLLHLLKMEQDELAKLRKTVERIEQMSPEEKTLLRARIEKLEKMKPGRVEALRQRFEAIPEETREVMRQRWLVMTPDERRTWRKKLRQLSRQERAEVFEEQGFLPPRGKPKKREPLEPVSEDAE